MSQFRVPVLETFSWQKPIINISNDAPTGSPTKGDRYLVGTPTPSNAFDGHANQIAWYAGDVVGWQFDTPAKGWITFVEATGAFYQYDGVSWGEADKVTSILNVDNSRTDNYTPNGSLERPYKALDDAVAAASASDLIKVAPGTYDTTSLTFSNISLIGSGLGNTIIESDLTFEGNDILLSDVKLTGLLTVNLTVGKSFKAANCVSTGTVVLEDGIFTSNGFDITATTGAALTVNGGEFILDNATISTTDTAASAIAQVGGVVSLSSVKLLNNSAAAKTVNSTGGRFKANFVSIKNSNASGTSASLDNSGSLADPNVLMGVFHNRGISCGAAHTFVQGVYSETPEVPASNDPTGTNLHFLHASQVRIDNTQFSVQVPSGTNMTLQEFLVWADANFGGPGPLGTCSDGAYNDGLLEWETSTRINDAIDDLNEVVRDLAPPQATSLAGLTLTANQTLRTAKIPSGLDSSWYAGGASAGATLSNIITANTLVLASPDPSTAFSKGDETLLEAHWRNNSSNDFTPVAVIDIVANFVENPPGSSPPRPYSQTLTDWDTLGDGYADGDTTSSPSFANAIMPFTMAGGGSLQITSVGWYNDFHMWQKMNAQINFSSLPQGFHSAKMVHDVRGTKRNSAERQWYYDDGASNALSFSTAAAIVEKTISSARYLSGVRYYSTNDIFTVTAQITNLFNKTYATSNVASVQFASVTTNLTPGHDPAIAAKSNIPDYNDAFNISQDMTINTSNLYLTSAGAVVQGLHPYKTTATSNTPAANRLINTYAETRSTDTQEYWTDEQYRLPLTFNVTDIPGSIAAVKGQWTPSDQLVNGNALVYNQRLQAAGSGFDFSSNYLPVGPDYSAFTGDQVYLRAFYLTPTNPKSGCTLTLPNLVAANVGAFGTGNVNIGIKLPGNGWGWWDIAAMFPANFNDVKTADGTGCQTAQSGNAWTLSFGTSSTFNSGGFIFIKITFRNMTNNIGSVMQITFPS